MPRDTNFNTIFELVVEEAKMVEYEDGQMVLTNTPDLDLKLFVPITSKGNIPDKGQAVTAYVPIDAATYDGAGGITRTDKVFGYRID